jgi:hypothetical protein
MEGAEGKSREPREKDSISFIKFEEVESKKL